MTGFDITGKLQIRKTLFTLEKLLPVPALNQGTGCKFDLAKFQT